MKEKIIDIGKIRNFEAIMKNGKYIDKESEELKNSFHKFKNDLKKAKYLKSERNKNTMDSYSEEKNYHSSNNPSPNKKKDKRYKNNSMDDLKSEEVNHQEISNEYQNITKKFHYIILQLQNELAQSVKLIKINQNL